MFRYQDFVRRMKFIPAWQWAALFLFIGLAGLYATLSPGSMVGMGYTVEEIATADRMLTMVDALRKGVPAPPMAWSRHGPLAALFDIPFVAVGKFIVSPDFIMSFEPVLWTAALLVLLFLWLRKVTSPEMSLVLTFAGAFGTMLWPYAYIGLEPKQSFFILLASYVALAGGPIRRWPRLIGFAAVCGVVVGLKSTGVVFFPVIAWLVYVQFEKDWRVRRAEIAAVTLTVGTMWALSAWSRTPFWAARGGGIATLKTILIDSPFTYFENWIGVFGSPNKGLFIYAPILLLTVIVFPRVLRTHFRFAIFALLVVGCTVAELAILRSPADEVWGSRYMHCTIAPLLVVLGAGYPRFEWRRVAPIAALAAIGVVISFLGAFFYYGNVHLATIQARQNTLEALAGDTVWNPVRFHARLFQIWLGGGSGPVFWTPNHFWLYEPPPDAPPVKAIDLRGYAQPQSMLLRLWNAPRASRNLWLLLFYLGAFAIGAASSVLAAIITIKPWPPPPGGAGQSKAGTGIRLDAASNAITSVKAEIVKKFEYVRRYNAAIWAIGGGVLFWIWGGLLPRVAWNAVEMIMGRNLLHGHGLSWSPLDPPALWRPPLGGFLCALFELFTSDPHLVYRLLYTVSLTTFLITSFYTVRALWGTMAANVGCLFIVTTGALTSRLVGHVHSISHVTFLLVAGPTLLLTVKTFERRTRLRLLGVGICWGFLYLARWETLLLFAATMCVLLYAAYTNKKDFRGLVNCSAAVLGFGMLFVPAMIYQTWAKAHYGIVGASALSTFYTGEAWIVTWEDPVYGDEDAGFAKAERLYGTYESNHGSLLRAIARNPAAFRARLGVNIRNFLALFLKQPEFFDPVWLVLLAGLVMSRLWMKRRLLLMWLVLLFLCSATICCFHIDPRYVVISAPFVLLMLCGGAAALGDWAGKRPGRWRSALVTGFLVILVLWSGSASYGQLKAAIRNPERRDGAREVVFSRGLAENFRQVVHRPVALDAVLPEDSKFQRSNTRFLLSYFAGTSITWQRTPLYPRDKFLSEIPKEPDYVYVNDEVLYQTDILLKARPIARYEQEGEEYFLFPRLEPPPTAYGDAQEEKIRAILARDYPELLTGLQERNAATALNPALHLPSREKPGRIGCGVLAFKPDGRDDLVFKIDLSLKPESPATAANITYMELQRRDAWGVVHTSNTHYLMGVACERGGPLLNRPDGSIKLPIGENNEFWLYACDDGANRPGTYWARVRIGRGSWVESNPVTLAGAEGND